ncbi:MAG: L,D-transpeptidase family protein [Deltaproteobacteria bacterium]
MKSKKVQLLFIFLAAAIILSLNLSDLFPLTQNRETSTKLKSKYMILIDVEAHRLYLFENKICIKQYLVATGKYDTPTPIGFFKIVHKDTWGEGFGGRWMGFNVPWGKYGIHGTIFPNSIGGATSHGCIRMWNKDVKEVYKRVNVGTPILIINGPYGPYGQGLRTLKPGDYGADVKAVQKRLTELGFYKYSADGKFGGGLTYSLNKFQESKKLPKRSIIGKPEYDAMGIVACE